MMLIPAQPLPNQSMQALLGDQNCTINLAQNAYGLFMTLYVGTETICSNVICQNLNRIVRDAYLGFIGDFIFNDTQGTSDPVYTGIGSRYQLIYLEAGDLPAGEG
jgi:hypothetical protein